MAHPLDGRADVYAAGVVLYQLLSGHRPFEAPTDAALIHRILTGAPDPLKPRAAHVPDALCALVMKALAKEPEHRFQSAAQFSSALERLVAASGVPNTNAETGTWMQRLFSDETPAGGQLSPGAAPAPSVHVRPAPAPIPLVTPAPNGRVGTEVDPAARDARAEFARESGLFDMPPEVPPGLVPSHGGVREELFEKPQGFGACIR